MRRYRIAMAALVAATAGWAGAAGGEAARQMALPSASVVPSRAKFANGRFVLVDLAGHDLPGARFSSVSVLDAGGRELVVPDGDNPPPDASRLEDAALTPDGVLVVAATLAVGREPVLAEYDLPHGKVLRIVHTDPVLCRAIAADAAGIWCVGLDIEAVNARRTDYDVVYRFSLTGERLQSLFRRNELKRREHGWRSADQLVYGNGRYVAWLPGDDAVLSWGPAGADPRQLAVETPEEPIPTDLGVLADGTAVLLRYIGRDAEEPAPPRRALFALDAGGRSPRLPGACDLFPPGYRLAGVDGEDLVFLDLQDRRFVWLPPRCPQEE